MATFDTILFDLDGTLIDHFEAIHRTHVETMTHFGLPAPTMEQVRSAVGGGLEEAMRKLYGRENTDLIARAVPFYRSVWPKHLFVGVKVLPGARELLQELYARPVKSAVFTNKIGSSARELCAHLQLSPFLHGIFGALDTRWLKPQREYAEHALKALGAKVATTLLVGDSPYDVQAAHNAGFPCWGVTTGTHNRKELEFAGADAIYDNLHEVAMALSR